MKAVRAIAKRYLPKSLLGRSIMIIIAPLIVLQIVSTWIFYDRHWDTITRRLAGAVAGEIGLVVDAHTKLEDPATARWLTGSIRNLGIAVGFRAGDALPEAPQAVGSGILDARLTNAMRSAVGRPFRIDAWTHEGQVRIQVQVPEGVMEFTVPRKRLFSSTTYIFVMWMVGTSLLLFAVATVFMRNQVRPIQRLAAAVDSFGKRREAPGFKPEGATEIRLAAQAFERMRNRIQNAMAQRTEMLAGISHDLRTPLTRMKIQLAMLGDSAAADALRTDLHEMEIMVEEFLEFARGEGTEEAVDTDAGEIVRSVAAQAGRVEAETVGDLRVSVRPNALRRCLTNLVTNALTHAQSVRISARRLPARIEFFVDDDGPGIPEAERESVFKPFYRLDAARNPNTGGTGLGLSIARDVARGHGGDVILETSPLGGVRATVRLPV